MPDPETGLVMDLKKLKNIIKDEITDKLDHKNLNEDVPFLKDCMPSIENLVIVIWDLLKPHITGGTLHAVKLVETENNYAEYYG
jgi:6-pyruvoyltetrahydropterin/6-carboxytetrahydropterin synthase